MILCDNGLPMPKIINIRNVPDELHREAKARAARAGMSLSAYMLREVRRILEEAAAEDILEQLREQEPPVLSETSVDAVRAERESR